MDYDNEKKICCLGIFDASAKGCEKCLVWYTNLSKNTVNNNIGYENNTALHIACKNGNENCVKILLKNGANIHKRNFDGWTPFIYACRYKHENIIKILLNNGVNVNEKCQHGCTPLLYACYLGNDKDDGCIELLLKHGANINEKAGVGTILHIACKHASNKIVKTLLEHGADYTITDKKGRLPHDCKHEVQPKNNRKIIDEFIENALEFKEPSVDFEES